MTVEPRQLPERRATSIRLTVDQLRWAKDKATRDRTSMQQVIEDAIVAAGAPPAEGEPNATGA